jgi:hypothetical protein
MKIGIEGLHQKSPTIFNFGPYLSNVSLWLHQFYQKRIIVQQIGKLYELWIALRCTAGSWNILGKVYIEQNTKKGILCSSQSAVWLVFQQDVSGTKYAKSRVTVREYIFYGLDDRGFRVRFPARAGNFSLHYCVQNGSGAHPASYPMGTRGSFPGVKRPEHEVDHSPPSSAEIKNAWSYTSTPPIRLHGVVLI